MNNKFSIIGSETQVATTESRSNLALCKRLFRTATFSNGCKALVLPLGAKNKNEAEQLLARSNNALAFVSGRLGRWLTPTFVIIKTSELNRRMSAK